MAEETTANGSGDYDLDQFGLEPLPFPPTTASVLGLVSEIIDSVPDSWTVSKSSANYSTVVYYKVIDGEPWFLRRSVHDHPFEWFKSALYEDHFGNMVKYYDVVKSVSQKVESDAWKGYTLKYSLPLPFAGRDIAAWLFKHIPTDNENEFIIVALPADIPLPEDATTRAFYSFFHRVRKTENNEVEWIMGQTSDMQGNLPRWLQSMSVAGILVNDVPTFVKWMDDNYASREEIEVGE
ncbi:hypothetical protein V1525DRAFT_209647 [Lipomyces kononenkoae]|uniref:Uncharacterized protein n=1 Tax=Lipomyces kononenkoae TaxID=34357 RepID=A0ACC3TAD1_LIPKO